MPSRIENIPADLANPELQVYGIDPDGWMEGTSSLLLDLPSDARSLTLRGMVPKIGDAPFVSDVELRLDDKVLARQSIGPGDFKLSAPVSGAPGKHRITSVFGATQALPGGDGRVVGGRLQFVGFDAVAVPVPSVQSDIVKGVRLRLGNGWGALETFQNETFRWVGNDAQVQLAPVAATRVELSIRAEAGPGIGSTIFLLEARDPAGKPVVTARVQGRSTVRLSLPVEPGKPGEFRLHVEGGGKTIANDPRILNFRVFEISAEPKPAQ